jgi:hypothetical protein
MLVVPEEAHKVSAEPSERLFSYTWTISSMQSTRERAGEGSREFMAPR